MANTSIKPAILITDNSVDTTGALNAILRFASYAVPHYRFIFVLPAGSRAIAKVKQQGFEVEALPFLEISKSLRSLLLYVPMLCLNGWRLKRLASKYQATMIHTNDFYNLTSIVAKVLGGSCKLLTHVRFMPDRFPALLRKLWVSLHLRYAHQIICVSHAVKRLLPAHAKIVVIYDGLSFVPDIPHQKIKKPYTQLLYLSHYIPGKGQEHALEAFRLAYQHNPALRLKFVGGDMGLEKNRQFKEMLIASAQASGLREVVTFEGPTENARQLWQEADIALNLSVSESFSMTCLEALAHGVPLIATDCGGPAELFEHGVSGWLVNNQDISAMCKAILQLAKDSELQEKFSRNSSNYVSNKFSEEHTLEALLHAYQTLLYC